MGVSHLMLSQREPCELPYLEQYRLHVLKPASRGFCFLCYEGNSSMCCMEAFGADADAAAEIVIQHVELCVEHCQA